MAFLPFCGAHVLKDKDRPARCVVAMRVFNAPYSTMLLEPDADSMYDTAAERMGKTFIGTELGGGGGSSAYTVAIAKKGIRNLLKHAGLLQGDLERAESLSLEMPDDRCFVFSESDGLLELCVDLGEPVTTGDLPLPRFTMFAALGKRQRHITRLSMAF